MLMLPAGYSIFCRLYLVCLGYRPRDCRKLWQHCDVIFFPQSTNLPILFGWWVFACLWRNVGMIAVNPMRSVLVVELKIVTCWPVFCMKVALLANAILGPSSLVVYVFVIGWPHVKYGTCYSVVHIDPSPIYVWLELAPWLSSVEQNILVGQKVISVILAVRDMVA